MLCIHLCEEPDSSIHFYRTDQCRRLAQLQLACIHYSQAKKRSVFVCRYFARLGRGQISVYETPECNLLDKKSIKLENVQDFQWSPDAPIISAYQAEQSSGNLPARVVLLKVPERTELRQKNLFSVSGAPSLPPLTEFTLKMYQ